MASGSKKARRSEVGWDDDDLPLTQDDLALIDGLCSQQQFEEIQRERSHNGTELPRTCSAPLSDGRGGKEADMMAPVQDIQGEIQMKEMIVRLQQEVLVKSGLVAMLQEEQRAAKDNASSELAAMDARLKAVKAEAERTANALRSELVFLTRENDETKRQLRAQKAAADTVELRCPVRANSQAPGTPDAVDPTPQKAPSRSGARLRRQLFPASPGPGAFPTTSSFNAVPRGMEPPPKRAVITPLKRSASWLSNNSPTAEKPADGHVGRAKSSPDQQNAPPRRVLDRGALERKLSLDQRRQAPDAPSPFDRRRTRSRVQTKTESPLAQALDARLSMLSLGNERRRLDRRLARTLVALQDEMVSHGVDFSVLPPLLTFERQTKVQHPLCRGAQGNYAAFTKNYHKFISVTLSADSPSESPGRTSDEEDEEQEEEEVVASCRRGEIKDWAILLHLLPCLANHVRLFANELHRRRSYIAEIDEDLIAAGGARGPKICPVTGSGPMDEFFDIVKELDMTPADLSDCPHLLFTPMLQKFRKQVSYALRWLLTMHQYCSQLRPWLHGEEVANFPHQGDLVTNLIRLLSDQRFYFKEELVIKRGALDLFCDICRRMPSSRRSEAFEGIRPFHLLLLCSDTRPLSSLRCFEALQHLVTVPSFRKDFDFHRGRRHCLWSVVFHVVNKLHRETWPRQRYCELLHLFASFAIAAVRSKMRLLHRGCSCNRGMYEALSIAALTQAQLMFYNRWEGCAIEAVERPLRALLVLMQAQGVQQFEEITANLFSLFALISMLKRVETCRGYSREMKAEMDMQLIHEFDDLEDEFHVGE